MITREDVVAGVRSFVGLSAKHDPNGELARLVDFPGGAPPEVEVLIKTNCAMFACGILRWLGKSIGWTHPLLEHQYVNGQAMTWLLEIAIQTNSLHISRSTSRPQKGDILHWATPPKPGEKPKNDDHVAFVTQGPDANRLVLRAGGGATDNLITETTKPEDYTVDHWRPIRNYINIVELFTR